MITSADNTKLKAAAKLRRRRSREKAGLFLTEGEDLLEAGLAAGREPEFALVRAGSGLPGDEVDPALLDRASTLESGTRALAVWPIAWSEVGSGPCIFLAGIADPGNTGSIIMHKRLDFMQVGRMPQVGTKFDRWLDLTFLQLVLDERPFPDETK